MSGWRKRGKGTNMFKELNIADIFVLRYNKTAEGKYQQTYTPEEFDQMQEWLDRALGEYTQSMEVENNMLRARNERLEKTLAQQEQGEPVAIPEYVRDAAIHLHENGCREPLFMVKAIVGWINNAQKALAKQEQNQPATKDQIREAIVFNLPLYTTPQPKQEQCKYPNCDYPRMNLPDCQEQGEPVAYLVTGPYEKQPFATIGAAASYCKGLNKGFGEDAYAVNSLYTTPQPAQKPLTDEQIWQLLNDCTIGGDLHADKFARAIEAAHGIKE
jgi:hypothetical protein